MAEFKIDGNKNPEAKDQAAKVAAERAIATITLYIAEDGTTINIQNVGPERILESLPCYIEAVIEAIVREDKVNDPMTAIQFKHLVVTAVNSAFEKLQKEATKNDTTAGE